MSSAFSTSPPPAPPASGRRPPLPWLGRLSRLARKELSEILRDRRTIFTLVLMPLLLYPLLAIAFRQFLLSSKGAEAAPVYRLSLAFRSPAEGTAVIHFLEKGERALEAGGAFRAASGPPVAGPSPPDREPRPRLQYFEAKDLEAEVLGGVVEVGLRPGPAEGPGWRPGPERALIVVAAVYGLMRPDGQPWGALGSVAAETMANAPELAPDWELLYREDSALGLEGVRYLQRLCAAANVHTLDERLRESGARPRPVPVRAQPLALHNPGPERSPILAALVPLILILMTITGAVYPAIDLTAGERERGTLEILVAAPVPRLSLLLAKYVAVLTVAMLTALVNLGTMAGTLLVTGVGQVLFGAGLSAATLAQVLALLLLFAAFFSAVLLALTSFARSFKEAQAYLIPLMLLALMPGMLSLIPGLRLNVPLAVTPLLNIVLLARDLFEGTADPGLAAVVVLTTLLYALAAVALAARVFGAEAVLYSQHRGWSDLFRRPRRPRPVPAPSAARDEPPAPAGGA
jgi:ABC-type Na+ efflux pump permease subunit